MASSTTAPRVVSRLDGSDPDFDERRGHDRICDGVHEGGRVCGVAAGSAGLRRCSQPPFNSWTEKSRCRSFSRAAGLLPSLSSSPIFFQPAPFPRLHPVAAQGIKSRRPLLPSLSPAPSHLLLSQAVSLSPLAKRSASSSTVGVQPQLGFPYSHGAASSSLPQSGSKYCAPCSKLAVELLCSALLAPVSLLAPRAGPDISGPKRKSI
ncbi:putative replication protein [Zea mays]|uniref:Putative replication protein n=1 Tax=Zea mays TaxID=4577 RepID=A0A1D6M2T5_MAIZE|nr:putative replication protein [Zea mays]